MLIRLTRYCVFQDAGREKPLYAGEAHDLPDTIAASLIATGRAVRVETVHLAVSEAKPMAPPERKRVKARA